jgi:hypothetical protein
MHDFSDQELDQLSREAAEQYDASPGALSWERFQQELDNAMPLGKDKDGRKKILWLILFAILILGGGAYWVNQGIGRKTSGGDAAITQSEPSKVPNGSAASAKPKDQAINPGTKSNPLPSLSNDRAQSAPREKSIAPHKSAAQPESNPQTKALSSKNQPVQELITKDKALTKKGQALTSGNDSKTKHLINKNQSIVASQPTADNTRNGSLLDQKGKSSISKGVNQGRLQSQVRKGTGKNAKNLPSQATNDQEVSTNQPGNQRPTIIAISQSVSVRDRMFATPLTLPNSKLRAYTSPSKPERMAATNADIKAARKPKPNDFLQPQRGFEIGAVYSPDWSNVKFDGNSSGGFNIGLLLGYNFSPRWSVEAGLIYTKKNYAAKGENFKFPPTYYNGYLLNANGYCKMFDIPINVRYNAIASSRQKVFVSAGLSTYLMNEEYYKFHGMLNGNYWQSWHANYDNTNYFFSIANLSLGYEYAFSRSFSLLAEPYFKFALSDIGKGNARINSMGMYAGLKYKPSFRKPRPVSPK